MKLAGAPISWGVCEVPGWGIQLPARRVLSEMRTLGLRATEAGAEGFLPDGGGELARVLAEHDIGLVGGFVPVVLHEAAALDDALGRVRAQAERFARAGGSMLVSAVVVDDAWSPRVPLSRDHWRRIVHGLARIDELVVDHGIGHVVHPHVGTLVESRDDVERVLEASDVRLCLDTGHFAVGGIDSVALVRETPHRVGHVHLKDVREGVAAELRAGGTSLLEATRAGLFTPLGDGHAPVADVVSALEHARYDGWYVLEQDTVIDRIADAKSPARDMRRSIDVLSNALGPARDLTARVTGKEVSRSRT